MVTRGEARGAALDRIAPLDADVLLAFALSVPKEALYAHPEVSLSAAELSRVTGLVERRAAGEPVAYLRGKKEFYGLVFAVDPRVLIPRPETETLVDAALAFVRRSGACSAADVGTGSGAIAIALALAAPGLHIIALDTSPDALEVARANVARHGVADRVELRAGDLLAPLDAPVDLVVANLPYLRDLPLASLVFEPALALYAGADGLALVRRATLDLARVLAPGGAAFFEIDPPQAPEVARLLEAAGCGAVRIVNDLAGDARVVAGERGLASMT